MSWVLQYIKDGEVRRKFTFTTQALAQAKYTEIGDLTDFSSQIFQDASLDDNEAESQETTYSASKIEERLTEVSGVEEAPIAIHSTGDSYSWSVADTQYISIVVTGVLIIDSNSAGAVDCSIQLQHGGAGTLATATVGLRGSLDTGRIPFALTYVVVGSGWDGNDFRVVEVTYGSTIEEVNWNFNYRL